MPTDILDKDGKPLSPEEAEEYTNDVWDCGIPMGKQDARRLWEKWGERLGMPEIFPELAVAKLNIDIQKGYHVMHKQTKRVGRVHSFDSSQSTVTVKWTDSDAISSHETSELNFSLFCNKKHSMYDLFCFLHPNHNGWCGCN